ncbi:putative sugar transporter [Violaceomyces palustris]|uniref:Sugar transporter n=1 Tax=Violaceomyces palustris TaxID=1673888 RepID=A0ACD0NVU8_9BASI|nr:putative sugar transporter [Violaceomyces palustris]
MASYKGGLVPRRVESNWVGLDVGFSGTWLMTVITVCCASGFLLVGYDNGVMGGLINTPAFQETFDYPDSNTIGNIVSLYEIGCFFGAMSTFVVGDFLGRRRTILMGSAFMVAGALIQGLSSTVGVMIAGRIVSGLGMGAINSTVPVLQAETSPAISRGVMVCLDLTALNFGIAISYWTDYGFNFGGVTGNKAWRIPILLQLVFIVVLAITAFIIPDTPRWLLSQGRDADAMAILERLNNAPASTPKVQEAYAGIAQALEHERAATVKGWKGLFAPGGGWSDDSIQSRKRLLLACFIQAAQQLGGINALIYYSTTLFVQSVGLGLKDASLLSGGVNMCLILGSTISIFLVDRVGRRMLLLPCISGMALVMAVQAGLVYKVEQPNSPAVYGRAASAMLFVFELFFSIGFQGTVWLIPSEILPLTIRTKGSALSTASNWIFNFLIVKITPLALDNIRWKTYIIFAVLNAAWVPILAIYLPETKGRSLEAIDELFATDGWHLDRANAHRAIVEENSEDVESQASKKDEGLYISTVDDK